MVVRYATRLRAATVLAIAGALASPALRADVGDENLYYPAAPLPRPDDLRLEVSGMATLADGRLAVAIRRGEVWLVDGLSAGDRESRDPSPPLRYTRFAEALHEPLGLLSHNGSLYTAQRSELTRLRDIDGDGRCDEYKAVGKGWGVSGNYHEYAYGPVLDREGQFVVALNARLGAKVVDEDAWRGWAVRISPAGKLEPLAAGLRSPCGLGGEPCRRLCFITDQQGNWVGTCTLLHLEKGAFYGHTDSLVHCERPGSPLERPATIPSGATVVEAARRIPSMRLPTVWFPYRKMGQSATDVLCDTTEGKFGPFAGQLFVGEFTLSGHLTRLSRAHRRRLSRRLLSVSYRTAVRRVSTRVGQ